MAVDQPRGARRHRDIRQQRRYQPGTDGGTVDRRNDRLGAVDDVVDQVFRLAPDAGAGLEGVDHLFDHLEVAAGGEGLAGTAQHHGADRGVGVNIAPNAGDLVVAACIQRIQALGTVQRDAQDALARAVKRQAGIVLIGRARGGIAFRHGIS
ncbi:hypothetical protein D3C81_1595860 [compost metagenome]